MYNYIAEFELWKTKNKVFKEKYSVLSEFTQECQAKCKDDPESNLSECLQLCKKPLVDLENFNISLTKRMCLEIYEVCNRKASKAKGGSTAAETIKLCADSLYKDNEVIIKSELLERMENIATFLK